MPILKFFVLLCVLLCCLIQSAQARGKIYGLTFFGTDPWGPGMNSSGWNVMCWFDTLLKRHRFDASPGFQLDTVINLWGDGTNRYGTSSRYHPRYRRPFVSDTGSYAKYISTCQWLAENVDSGDILIVMFGGHGIYEQSINRCDIEAYGWPDLLCDTTAARCLNVIPCTLRIIYGWPSQWFGNGRHPDSSGFGTQLYYNVSPELRQKTLFFSHAGPQPQWSSVLSDDRRYSGGPGYQGFENLWYRGNQFHWIEGTFPFECVFDGGVEPSYYWADSLAPGFYFDSIDVAPQDGRLSAYEDSVWIYRWHSQLGWSRGAVLHGLSMKRVCFWPYIGFIDSLDALPVSLFLPDTVDSGAIIRPIVQVKNLGFMSSNVPVRLRIGNGYNQVQNKTIAPNREDTLWFPDWQASETGLVAVVCSTELNDDEKPENDLLLDSIYILPVGVGESEVSYPHLPVEQLPMLPILMSKKQFAEIRQRFQVFDITGRAVTGRVDTGIYIIRTEMRICKIIVIK